jgi:hypothetical protein
MLNLLAQTVNYTFDGSSGTLTTSEKTGLAGFFALYGFFAVIWLAVAVAGIIGMWKIFEKAGVEGWKAIIPIYNSWTLAEIAGKPGWWGLAPLVYAIPIIGWMFGWILVLVVYVLIALELAKRFGKDQTFAIVFLIIFSIVGILMLGFGDAKYTGKPFKTLDNNAKS